MVPDWTFSFVFEIYDVNEGEAKQAHKPVVKEFSKRNKLRVKNLVASEVEVFDKAGASVIIGKEFRCEANDGAGQIVNQCAYHTILSVAHFLYGF